jgi:TPR repeat protein
MQHNIPTGACDQCAATHVDPRLKPRERHGSLSRRCDNVETIATGRRTMIRFVRGQVAALLFLSLVSVDAARAAGLDDAGAALIRGDYALALSIIRPLANGGDARAQFNLGLMYRNGQGVAQNFAGSALWIRRAAEQGDSEAALALGLIFHNGMGVKQDLAEALSWYRIAAAHGNVVAMRTTARYGVRRDDMEAEAKKWYSAAASLGDSLAPVQEHG